MQEVAPKREYLCALLDRYGSALSGRCREVLESYYADDLSLAEIAENTGITRQGVRDAVKRGEAELLSLEKALGYHEKACRAIRLAAELTEGSSDPSVKEKAAEIAALFES